ncbi:MAG: hypothetical protein IPP40_07305 [bacterium]|nr:hypothetical protein [bacterium]
MEDTVLKSTELWLGVAVGGDPEMMPRTKIQSVPYALHAGTVDNSSGGTITGNLIIQGSVNVGFFNEVSDSAFVAGVYDTASGAFSSVGGGYGNAALDSYSTVAGGFNNKAGGDTAGLILIDGSGPYSFIGGGEGNRAIGTHSFVGGGVDPLTMFGRVG